MPGGPPTFTLAQRREIKKLTLSRPVDHDLAFSTWSLAKLADLEAVQRPGLRSQEEPHPVNASWPNRIEAQFQALRYFTLDGTDSSGHAEQATMIRRYVSNASTPRT
jgi:hypothetical protein